MFLLSMLLMPDRRMDSRHIAALEASERMKTYLEPKRLREEGAIGLGFQASVETGVTAMLAGAFQHALSRFTQAQLLPLVLKFPFLTRKALVQSALIHACVGNAGSAVSLLDR